MQLTHEQIHYILDQYLSLYPHEQEKLTPLFDFLETTQGDLYNRKNMDGHITWSGVIVNPERQETLLIYHNFFKMYQQPGWHIDPGETPLYGAQRECQEETGVTQLKYLPIHHIHIEVPLTIGCHIVPPNDKKNEGEHWHFDFVYVFETTQKDIHIDDDGVSDAKWFMLEEIGERLPSIPDKIKKLD